MLEFTLSRVFEGRQRVDSNDGFRCVRRACRGITRPGRALLRRPLVYRVAGRDASSKAGFPVLPRSSFAA